MIKETKIKENRNEQLRREETLWRQKARLNWLTTTDLNTKFFHTSTTIRRCTNSIESLKINPQTWTTEIPVILNKFLEHFKEIFTTSNPIMHTEMSDLFHDKISNLENKFFYEVPSYLEILSTQRPPPTRPLAQMASPVCSISNIGTLSKKTSMLPSPTFSSMRNYSKNGTTHTLH